MIGKSISHYRVTARLASARKRANMRERSLEAERDVLESISKSILNVGEEIGLGQTVKAALQAFIGCTFAGIFESLVLDHKAGVKGETLYIEDWKPFEDVRLSPGICRGLQKVGRSLSQRAPRSPRRPRNPSRTSFRCTQSPGRKVCS